MRVYELILKKRDGGALAPEEISWLVKEYVAGGVPDYQMAAFLMAVFFRGLSPEETAALTLAMIDSGVRLDLSPISGVKVDKHSTGGVGDKTTLVLAPLVAAAGLPFVKLAGRGLGHTGGTIDKLESIPGLRTDLSQPQILSQVQAIGVAVAAQTEDLVPADKKLYALRDLTATVESLPLIAASIMSKKIAAGADAILLDVKVGSGAFMKDEESAVALAETMIALGRSAGRKVRAVVTAMHQPLGRAVGNALEVAEAIATLKGRGPEDFRELCLTLAGHLIEMGGAAASPAEGYRRAEELLASGRALEKFRQMIAAQGGDPGVVEEPEKLPAAPFIFTALAPADGYVQSVDARSVGLAAMALGAGRRRKEDSVDPAVGITLQKKAGDRVKAGDVLATIHARERGAGQEVMERLLKAFSLGPEPPASRPLIYRVVS
ncbi:MAG: pyrimidine-nucleoside phosphorylase [Clostridia bacterium]|nr:pyrimidine-nucleoside phosphorylase [Clostridia bacterium]